MPSRFSQHRDVHKQLNPYILSVSRLFLLHRTRRISGFEPLFSKCVSDMPVQPLSRAFHVGELAFELSFERLVEQRAEAGGGASKTY